MKSRGAPPFTFVSREPTAPTLCRLYDELSWRIPVKKNIVRGRRSSLELGLIVFAVAALAGSAGCELQVVDGVTSTGPSGSSSGGPVFSASASGGMGGSHFTASASGGTGGSHCATAASGGEGGAAYTAVASGGMGGNGGF